MDNPGGKRENEFFLPLLHFKADSSNRKHHPQGHKGLGRTGCLTTQLMLATLVLVLPSGKRLHGCGVARVERDGNKSSVIGCSVSHSTEMNNSET